MSRLQYVLASLAHLSICVFLTITVLGYDPADTCLNGNYYPANAVLSNPCSYSGALTSELMFTWLGWGVYFFLASYAVYVVSLMCCQRISQIFLRLMGWWTACLGLVLIFAISFHDYPTPFCYGPGGYIGEALRVMMVGALGNTGLLIFAISTLCAGLLLFADRFMFGLLDLVFRQPMYLIKDVIMGKEPATDNNGEETVSIRNAQNVGNVRNKQNKQNAQNNQNAQNTQNTQSIKNAKAAGKPQNKQNVQNTQNVQSASSVNTGVKPTFQGPSVPAMAPPNPLSGASEGKVSEDNDGALIVPPPPVEQANYDYPPLTLLKPAEPFDQKAYEAEIEYNSQLLEMTFADFKLNIKVVDHQTGPVLTMYEIQRERGVRLNKITVLDDDLAVAMKAPGVRVVAPLPGKDTIGIEIPNQNKKSVRLREVIECSRDKTTKMFLPVYLGRDVTGAPIFADLAKLPHLLIAGQTGSGKSVCLHSIIMSLIMTRSPAEVRLLMIDPKMVELSQYKFIPHLMHPVVTEMKKAEAILSWAVEKMEQRYMLLARMGVRQLADYNALSREEKTRRLHLEGLNESEAVPERLPFIVIVVDELADMMMTAPKEVDSHIQRLSQKSRAVGIHLVLATQKPTRDIITGVIKGNLPARIAFKVTSLIDSRVVLDLQGAERLLGSGDMLFQVPGRPLIRGQGAYLDDLEIERVINHVSMSEPNFNEELMALTEACDGEASADQETAISSRDPLYIQAVDVVIANNSGSTSMLQNRLVIGYPRASRLINAMADDHIVGPHNGGKPREVLISPEDWEIMKRQRLLEGQKTPESSATSAPLKSPYAAPRSEPEPDRVMPEAYTTPQDSQKPVPKGGYDTSKFVKSARVSDPTRGTGKPKGSAGSNSNPGSDGWDGPEDYGYSEDTED